MQNGGAGSDNHVWMEKLPEPVKVYNLSVEDVHNYYVSEKGVLVHNECPKNNKVNIESGSTSIDDWINNTADLSKHSPSEFQE